LYKSIPRTVYLNSYKRKLVKCLDKGHRPPDRCLVCELYGPTEDARVVATDVENLVTLQFQMTVQGIN
jgi:hypothetical protein